MKENNSFESVDSNNFNENTENNDNSDIIKENLNKIVARKSTKIIDSQNIIKKSIIFTDSKNDIDNDNLIINSLTKNNNLISTTFSEKNNLANEINSNKKTNILSSIDNNKRKNSSSLNKDKKEQLCLDISEIKNNKITLVKIIDQYFYEGHLKLKNNLESEYVIFKIINDKQYYSITPSLYYIEPGKDITINIKRFEKLSINETKNIYDFLVVVVTHTKNTIEDVNDAKIYLRKEDLYSPEYEIYSFTINLDYGYNPNFYKKEEEERENILNQYKNQLNMNNINDPDEVRGHIEDVKKEIKEYLKKINNLNSILGDINKENIIKQEETIFDKETYYEVSKGKIYKEYDEEEVNDETNYIPLPLVILYFSISLFIGKFLKSIIWNKK